MRRHPLSLAGPCREQLRAGPSPGPPERCRGLAALRGDIRSGSTTALRHVIALPGATRATRSVSGNAKTPALGDALRDVCRTLISRVVLPRRVDALGVSVVSPSGLAQAHVAEEESTIPRHGPGRGELVSQGAVTLEPPGSPLEWLGQLGGNVPRASRRPWRGPFGGNARNTTRSSGWLGGQGLVARSRRVGGSPHRSRCPRAHAGAPSREAHESIGRAPPSHEGMRNGLDVGSRP